MNAEIITIGDEILIGQVVDTNSAWLGEYLNNFGIQVNKITSIHDSEEDILKSLNNIEANSELVIYTGGLGPTKDDITKQTFCKYFGSKLVTNEEVLIKLEKFFSARGKKVTKTNKLQAEVPHNCTVLQNESGTAPGMWFEKNNKIIVSLPGVPYEMKMLIENEVLPKLNKQYSLPIIKHKTLHVIGIAESDLSDRLHEFEMNLPKQIKLAYLPSPGFVRLRISGYAKNQDELTRKIQNQVTKLKMELGSLIYSENNESLSEVIGKILNEKKSTLATAESCTGGNIAAMITSISGSSNYFKGSVVAYSNEIKENILNVDHNNIKKFGAVSEQVVKEMVNGVIEKVNADYAVATSGIAGPTGGKDEKPVGTIWIAVGNKNKIISKKFNFGYSRERNITRASLYALNMLRLFLNEN